MGLPLLKLEPAFFDQEDSNSDRLQSLAFSIMAALATYPHYVVVDGYPVTQDRTQLMEVAHAIARLDKRLSMVTGISSSTQSRDTNPNVSFTKVHINAAKAQAGNGVTQYSRTHLPLSPHTDSSYMPHPHELVAFQCIRAAEAGGESIMIPVVVRFLNGCGQGHLIRLQDGFNFLENPYVPILSQRSNSASTYAERFIRNDRIS